jgi:hypothetical protein
MASLDSVTDSGASLSVHDEVACLLSSYEAFQIIAARSQADLDVLTVLSELNKRFRSLVEQMGNEGFLS